MSDEVISHFIAEGKVRYTSKESSDVLEPGDSIFFKALSDDYFIETLEDSLIFVYNTSSVKGNKELDKIVTDQLDEIEKRDHYTKTHCGHVCEYATKIAMVLGFHSSSFLADLSQAASLHDVGKIRTPDSVLLKPSSLNEEEYEIIKKHPQDGYDILKEAGVEGDELTYVLQHHERLDGSGYPHGLTDPEIADGSKIIMVADCFDAMTTDRCYRHKYSDEVALEIIRGEVSKGRLDSDVLPALEECLNKHLFTNHSALNANENNA